MGQNRKQFFYEEGNLTQNYKDNRFTLQCATKHMRIEVTGGTLVFNLTGGDDDNEIDGKLLPGENLPFNGLETQKIAVRNPLAAAGTFRIWGYK